MEGRIELGLYIVTYSDAALGRDHVDVARAALEGGADALQLRDKKVGGREVYRLATQLRELVEANSKKCIFLVNDRVDVALAAGAHGVHLGQDDLPAAQARTIIGESKIMGVSAETVEEAMRARDDGADYLGVGPIYATPTKADAGAPIGVEGLRKIRDAVMLPLVAIGGINEDNVGEVLEAGADGIAVISAVTAAADMRKAVRRLRIAVDAGLSRR